MWNRRKQLAALTVVAGLLGLSVMEVVAQTPSTPDSNPHAGTPRTITYKDDSGKDVTVFDLTGKWGVFYRQGWDVVNIKQQENKFVGTKTRGNAFVGMGAETIRGHIEGNNIHCQIYDSNVGWQFVYVEKIDLSGNSFKCKSPQSTIKYDRELK